MFSRSLNGNAVNGGISTRRRPVSSGAVTLALAIQNSSAPVSRVSSTGRAELYLDSSSVPTVRIPASGQSVLALDALALVLDGYAGMTLAADDVASVRRGAAGAAAVTLLMQGIGNIVHLFAGVARLDLAMDGTVKKNNKVDAFGTASLDGWLAATPVARRSAGGDGMIGLALDDAALRRTAGRGAANVTLTSEDAPERWRHVSDALQLGIVATGAAGRGRPADGDISLGIASSGQPSAKRRGTGGATLDLSLYNKFLINPTGTAVVSIALDADATRQRLASGVPAVLSANPEGDAYTNLDQIDILSHTFYAPSFDADFMVAPYDREFIAMPPDNDLAATAEESEFMEEE